MCTGFPSLFLARLGQRIKASESDRVAMVGLGFNFQVH